MADPSQSQRQDKQPPGRHLVSAAPPCQGAAPSCSRGCRAAPSPQVEKKDMKNKKGHSNPRGRPPHFFTWDTHDSWFSSYQNGWLDRLFFANPPRLQRFQGKISLSRADLPLGHDP